MHLPSGSLSRRSPIGRRRTDYTPCLLTDVEPHANRGAAGQPRIPESAVIDRVAHVVHSNVDARPAIDRIVNAKPRDGIPGIDGQIRRKGGTRRVRHRSKLREEEAVVVSVSNPSGVDVRSQSSHRIADAKRPRMFRPADQWLTGL